MKSKTIRPMSLFDIKSDKTVIHHFKDMLTKEEYEESSNLVKKFRLNITSRATTEDFKLFINYLVTFRDYITELDANRPSLVSDIKFLHQYISSIYSRLTRKHPKEFEYWSEHFQFCYKNKLLRDLRKSLNLGLGKCGDNYKMYIEKLKFEYNVKEDVKEGRKFCIKAIELHKTRQNEIVKETVEGELNYYQKNEIKDSHFLSYAKELLNLLTDEAIKERLKQMFEFAN